MAKDKPYLLWSREEIKKHLVRVANYLEWEEEDIKELEYAAEDKNWDPSKDYNGCSFVQDPFHPYPPCFLHDYDQVVGKGGEESDNNFKRRLKKSGMKEYKVITWFIGVRFGWFLYLKKKYGKR